MPASSQDEPPSSQLRLLRRVFELAEKRGLELPIQSEASESVSKVRERDEPRSIPVAPSHRP